MSGLFSLLILLAAATPADGFALSRFPKHRITGVDLQPQASSLSKLTAAAAEVELDPCLNAVVNVDLDGGARSYPIYIGRGLFGEGDGNFASTTLRKHLAGTKVMVVTNDRVGPLHLAKVVAALKQDPALVVETLVLPDGEEEKTMDNIMTIMDAALATRMDRRSTFVALGGGVVGDMVGFAAAIYQRGVSFIQVPTTLMAMVDSSVGGKTGVNRPLGKNMVGCFHQPNAVLIDTAVLDTLPDRELASGVAEVVKYGLIRDPGFFTWLEETGVKEIVARDPDALAEAIERSCVNKAEVVAMDEKEAGVRATLNLGHTFGHAVETGLGYGAWLHGEAVSLGMVMAADMSCRLGWVEPELKERVVRILEASNLPVDLPKGCALTAKDFRDAMAVDKKVADGVLRLILLQGDLGSCAFTGEYDRAKLDDTIDAFVRS